MFDNGDLIMAAAAGDPIKIKNLLPFDAHRSATEYEIKVLSDYLQIAQKAVGHAEKKAKNDFDRFVAKIEDQQLREFYAADARPLQFYTPALQRVRNTVPGPLLGDPTPQIGIAIRASRPARQSLNSRGVHFSS